MRKRIEKNELIEVKKSSLNDADLLLNRYIFKNGFNANKANQHFMGELLRLVNEVSIINEVLSKIQTIKEV